jgi:hypothetical protein
VTQPGDLLIGPLVKHFTYDGLGRLIRTQSPIPDPQTSTTLQTTLPLRSERHYYDGVRRISTLTIDPLIPIIYGGGEGPGEEEPTPIGGGGLDPQGLPLEGEAQQQRQLGDGDTPGEDPPFELPEALVTLREFVCGPGDGYAGVDELLVHFDPQRRPIYIAQDASGDVVAAFDLLGPPARPADADPEIPANLFTARRVWQATYDPYGQVLSARIEHPHDPLWTGHKGLFVERLDAGVMDGLPSLPTGAGQGSGLDLPRLTPASTLLAHARNRWLHTRLGIWGSMDPNASGQGVIGAAAHSGTHSRSSVLQADLAVRHTDGSSLYLYTKLDPMSGADALGLMFDRWDDEDDFAHDMIGMTDAGTSGALSVLYNLASEYAENLEWDVNWASDWSLSDDEYTRLDSSWVTENLISTGISLVPGASFDPSDPSSFVMKRGSSGAGQRPAPARKQPFRPGSGYHSPGTKHGNGMLGLYKNKASKYGPKNVRTHQAATDSTDKVRVFDSKGKSCLPDFQATVTRGKHKGKKLIGEFRNTQSEASLERKRLQYDQMYGKGNYVWIRN